MSSGARPVRAPRGTAISCRGWQQEAVLRMLMNNLDPEVAERPDDLVVYGGTGRAARSQKLERVLTADPEMGAVRHVDAGYERAIEVAGERGLAVPMLDQR